MKWQDKLTKSERHHVYMATRGASTLQTFKAERGKKLKLEPVYGCCLECYEIAKKLGIE
jgi:hypothetical protein